MRSEKLPQCNLNEMVEGLEEITLFVDGGEESREAETLLQNRGLKYKRIDVSSNGLRGWLLFEYGTAKVPLLVAGGTVVIGIEEIKKFCSAQH